VRPAVLVVLALFAAPVAARADAPAPSGSPPGAALHLPSPSLVPVPREVSYALETLAADGLAAALVGGALLLDGPFAGAFLGGPGIVTYALGAPVVHFAKGHHATSVVSLGMRIGAPYLGAMLGNLIGPKDRIICDIGEDCPEPKDSTLGRAVGIGVGALAAIVFDARYLARKRVLRWVPPVAPTASYTRTGFTLGLTGAF
jgi:hypothetical protein